LAAITALIICLALGPAMIRWLRRLKYGQEIREEGVKAHQAKKGTPTMGGTLIIVGIGAATLLWADLRNLHVWVALFALLAHGAIGFLDDYLKIAKKRSLGLQGRWKIVGQVTTALIVGATLIFLGDYQTTLSVPFFKTFRPDLGAVLYIGFMLVVMTGSSNAVNLTDGLDGLAISTTFVVALTLAGFTFVTGYEAAAQYLGLIANPEVWETTIFCTALAGASLGFLWFNAPPAEVFMGDVGSLAIGGGIGCVAVIIKQELLLIVIGGVFVIEALSVMVQVAYYKMTKDPKTGIGKRIFRMSPLHHHFEEIGWKEPKIVFRFLILQIFFVLLSLATLKLR
jgi:phospho-N-acetylmuramoyl-pentapeptide-transferase